MKTSTKCVHQIHSSHMQLLLQGGFLQWELCLAKFSQLSGVLYNEISAYFYGCLFPGHYIP